MLSEIGKQLIFNFYQVNYQFCLLLTAPGKM